MGYKLTNLCAWEGLQLACSFLDITVIFKNHDQLVQYDLQQIPVFGVPEKSEKLQNGGVAPACLKQWGSQVWMTS